MRALRNVPVSLIRLNTDDLLTGWILHLTPTSMQISSEQFDVNPKEVTAVYYRRAYSPRPPANASQDAADFIVREARTVLRALYAELRCPWISHHAAISAAENKPTQLSLAARLGFSVPATIVTNDPLTARQFALCHHRVVLKALSYGDLGGGRVLHTTLIETWAEDFDADIRVAPHLLQRFIEKAYDYRVTVVDNSVFACRIDSQAFPEYSVDMRRGLADERMHHEQKTLPDTVSKLCVAIVAQLGLRFGAIDLIQDRSGQFWFLEINPNGQWAWIQDRTGAPIASTIAKALTRND